MLPSYMNRQGSKWTSRLISQHCSNLHGWIPTGYHLSSSHNRITARNSAPKCDLCNTVSSDVHDINIYTHIRHDAVQQQVCVACAMMQYNNKCVSHTSYIYRNTKVVSSTPIMWSLAGIFNAETLQLSCFLTNSATPLVKNGSAGIWHTHGSHHEDQLELISDCHSVT